MGAVMNVPSLISDPVCSCLASAWMMSLSLAGLWWVPVSKIHHTLLRQGGQSYELPSKLRWTLPVWICTNKKMYKSCNMTPLFSVFPGKAINKVTTEGRRSSVWPSKCCEKLKTEQKKSDIKMTTELSVFISTLGKMMRWHVVVVVSIPTCFTL